MGVWLAELGAFGASYNEAVGGTIAEWVTGLLTAAGLFVAAVEFGHLQRSAEDERKEARNRSESERLQLAAKKHFTADARYQYSESQWESYGNTLPSGTPKGGRATACPHHSQRQAWSFIRVKVECKATDARIDDVRVTVMAPSAFVAHTQQTWSASSLTGRYDKDWAEPPHGPANDAVFELATEILPKVNSGTLNVNLAPNETAGFRGGPEPLTPDLIQISVHYRDETQGWVKKAIWPKAGPIILDDTPRPLPIVD